MRHDHLFEWYLSLSLSRKAKKIPRSERLITKHVAVEKTDLQDLHLAYDQKGQLNLADIRPIGFLIRSKA